MQRSTQNRNPSVQSSATGDNTQKDPSNWTTGGEPMTGAQKSYLHTLAQETHTEVSDDLTKGEASKKISELKELDPRTNGAQ